ncbi:helix-turn-helix transcriptional regulator [Microbacterium sp.]|uniref:helix-turn-helix transcriptional regulator n=1 Tax=Microbacterium sp. TaxID=51671 RepID=UPI0039E25B91
MPNELGEFLRARRTDAGLAPPHHDDANRRRSTGLRREEVAAASGISVDYYTRLEQGREAHPSDSVLNALARVLCLPPDACEHLYRLRGPHPLTARGQRDDAGLLRERMTAIVTAVRPNPAYVLDRLSNMVAANAEGLDLYSGFADREPQDRNTLRYLMTDSRAQQIFVEWEEIARGAVAHLRAANADDLQDPELHTFVTELQARSPLFAEWWSGHLVERRRTSITHIRTGKGIVARRHEVFYLPEDGLRMTLWITGTSSESL